MGYSGILHTVHRNWNKNSRWVGKSGLAGIAGGYAVKHTDGLFRIQDILTVMVIYYIVVAAIGFYQHYYPEEEDHQTGVYTSKRID